MSGNNPPAVSRSLRVEFDLDVLVNKIRDEEGKSYSKFVNERLRLALSDDWNFAGQMIKYADREIKMFEDIKVFYKEILLKEEKRQQAAKEEAKRQELGEAEATEANKKEILINHIRLLQDHVEGRRQLWVKDDDPMDFMYFDGEPNPNYRKLPRGQLNNELQQFYNDNFHLLV